VVTKNKSKDLSQRNSIGGISPQHFHHHKNQYSYFINSLAKHRRIYRTKRSKASDITGRKKGTWKNARNMVTCKKSHIFET
jgi:hypothetical protein